MDEGGRIMADERGFASYAFLVQVDTKDYDLVNSFGTKAEDDFKEKIIRKIMTSLAEHADVIAISIDPIIGMREFMEQEIEEEVEDE